MGYGDTFCFFFFIYIFKGKWHLKHTLQTHLDFPSTGSGGMLIATSHSYLGTRDLVSRSHYPILLSIETVLGLPGLTQASDRHGKDFSRHPTPGGIQSSESLPFCTNQQDLTQISRLNSGDSDIGDNAPASLPPIFCELPAIHDVGSAAPIMTALIRGSREDNDP